MPSSASSESRRITGSRSGSISTLLWPSERNPSGIRPPVHSVEPLTLLATLDVGAVLVRLLGGKPPQHRCRHELVVADRARGDALAAQVREHLVDAARLALAPAARREAVRLHTR